MKLKFHESAQPIANLEYNIEKNILPQFAKYGLNFNSKPTKINKYEYLYNGVSDGIFNQLNLSTTNINIDEWNSTNSDIYVADLFCKLTLNGKVEKLGPISSTNSDSIDYAMQDVNIKSSKISTDEDLENNKIIKPINNNSDLGVMTKAEWIKKYKELHDELADLEAQLQKADEEDDDETYYRIAKGPYKEKREYWDKIFIPNFPIDNYK